MNSTANRSHAPGIYCIDDDWPSIVRLYHRLGRDADKIIDPISLEQVLAIEPRAKALLAAAPAYCKDCDFYRGPNFKASVIQLVGTLSERTELRSSSAYDVLYHAVYDQMQDGCPRCTPDGENEEVPYGYAL